MRLGLRLVRLAGLVGILAPGLLLAGDDPASSILQAGTRNFGMAGGGSALAAGAGSQFCNPALLTELYMLELEAGAGNHSGSLLPYGVGAYPFAGSWAVGAGWTGGDAPSGQVSIGIPLSPQGRLSAGVGLKYLEENLEPGNSARGFGSDLGLLYTLMEREDGFSWRLGASLQDAQTVLKNETGEMYLPTTYRVGAGFSLPGGWSLLLDFASRSPAAGGGNSLNSLQTGIEHAWFSEEPLAPSLRLGYLNFFDSRQLLSGGGGIELDDWRLDYGFQISAPAKVWSHQLSLSWAGGRKGASGVHKSEARAAAPTPVEEEPNKAKLVRLFSALESAAKVQDQVFSTPTPELKPTPTPALAWDRKPVNPSEEETTYSMPVPSGPADSESASLGVSPEMPAFFSGYFSKGKGGGGLTIHQSDARLQAVVNPFSPNNDGKQDRTVFVGSLLTEKYRVGRWIINIFRGTEIVRSFHGGSRLPRNLEWDGKDGRGKVLSDGTYNAVLRILNENGIEIASASQAVEIRTQSKPLVLSGPENSLLTGGRADEPLVFSLPRMRGSSNWKFRILNALGQTIYEQDGGGEAPQEFRWVPRQKGKAVSAGSYRARMDCQDEIGLANHGEFPFRIQYAKFETLALVPSSELFTPKSRGGQGVVFSPQLEGDLTVKSWNISIRIENNSKVVRIFSGKGRPPSSLEWDGADSEGNPAESGRLYRGVLTVFSEVETSVTADSPQIQCDLSAYSGKQALAINLVRILFGPGDAQLDAAAQNALNAAVTALTQYKTDFELQIIGHCTPRESAKPVELSRERAGKVAEFLVQVGKVSAEKIQTVGRGDSQPFAKETSEEATRKNRRVEVLLIAR